MSGSFGSMSVHLGDGARIGCHTYPEKPGTGPILFIDADGVSLAVYVGSRSGADDTDVANARALAYAAVLYLVDVERLHSETNDQAADQAADANA